MTISKQDLRWLREQIQPYGGDIRGFRSNFLGNKEADNTVPCIIDDNGVFDFISGDQVSPADDARVLDFSELPGNYVHDRIASLDARFTKTYGLRVMGKDGRLTPVKEQIIGRTLLLVHGTFSNSENIIDQFERRRLEFLQLLLERYDNVLTFDYPTLSQQAIASAMTLDRLIRAFVPGTIDVVSHSQGGLVVRYWLELLARERLEQTTSVFVAGTLAGTALAAPWALRRALQGVFNMGSLLKPISSFVVPMISALISVLQKTTKFLASAPITDAGVALVPGFQGMSQVSTNFELIALQKAVTHLPAGYFAVTGDFEPEPVGLKIWKRLYSRTANAGADLLFKEPNDLVVNTAAMTHLADRTSIPPERVFHFRAGEKPVHHTNYFEQRETADHLSKCLKLS